METPWQPKPPIDKETALRRLRNRWNELGDRFPTFRGDIPWATYMHANLRFCMRHGLLETYD